MRRPLYDGAIKANQVGAFQRLGTNFQLIHPGYDSQARRRTTWTQVVYDGVPIWEWKVSAKPEAVLSHFDTHFATHIGRDRKLLAQVLQQTLAVRRARFRDGVSGVEPAPTLTADPREDGRINPS